MKIRTKKNKVDNLDAKSESPENSAKSKTENSQVEEANTTSRSLVVGSFIVLITLVAVSGLSLTIPTKSSKNIEVLGAPGISINVEIGSPVFRDSYTPSSSPEYCNDPKPYRGISNSALFLSDKNSKSLGSVKLGKAVKYDIVGCKYQAFIELNESFNGGEVSIFVKFPFGESETFMLDVGNQRPFKIDLKLNLG